MKQEVTESRTDLKSQIAGYAREAIEDDQFFLVDVVIRGQKGSRVIDVYVDGDRGIGLDDLATISRQLGFLIETADIIRGKYYLNVSSPGPERALRDRRQYAKYVGKSLSLKLASEGAVESVSSPDPVEGVLLACSDERLTLQLPKDQTVEIAFENVSAAQVVLPW